MNNNYTTTEQSDRLINAGVPASSADCYFYTKADKQPKILTTDKFDWLESPYIPCWSVGRLIEIFDACYVGEEEYRDTNLNFNCHSVEDMVHMINYRYKLNDIDFSKL